MKLWEINMEIARFLEENIDPETGELQNAEKLDELNMERKYKLEAIALYIKNLASDAEQLKAEEASLKARRERKERRKESLKRFLEGQLSGEKLETPKVLVTFRRSEAVVVDSPLLAIVYLTNQNYTDCIRRKEPEIDKNAVKRLLKTGVDVPGIRIEERQSIAVN